MLEGFNAALDVLERAITYGEQVDVAALARRAGTSEHHFRRTFSSLAGMPVGHYARRRRMTIAAADVLADEVSLLHVAVKHGYSSTEAFGRAFHAVHGVGAGEARRTRPVLVSQPPISFHLAIEGSTSMQYRIVNKPAFRVVGLKVRVPLVHLGRNNAIEDFVEHIDPAVTAQIEALSDQEPNGLVSVVDALDDSREEGTELTYWHAAITDRPAPEGLEELAVPPGTWVVLTGNGVSYPEGLQLLWRQAVLRRADPRTRRRRARRDADEQTPAARRTDHQLRPRPGRRRGRTGEDRRHVVAVPQLGVTAVPDGARGTHRRDRPTQQPRLGVTDRPRVLIYNEVSVDGCVEGFVGDGIRYYRQGFAWPCDAILMGSVTARNFGPNETPVERTTLLPPLPDVGVPSGFEDLHTPPGPLLVVPDSRGSLRNWRHAQAQPWYRSALVLLAEATPDEYRTCLDRRGIDHLTVGRQRVDLVAALQALRADWGIERVRTDGGGRLNGALLAAGLVDEIALIVSPVVAGRVSARSVVELPVDVDDRGISLQLQELTHFDDGALLLHYFVQHSRSPQ